MHAWSPTHDFIVQYGPFHFTNILQKFAAAIPSDERDQWTSFGIKPRVEGRTWGPRHHMLEVGAPDERIASAFRIADSELLATASGQSQPRASRQVSQSQPRGEASAESLGSTL